VTYDLGLLPHLCLCWHFLRYW